MKRCLRIMIVVVLLSGLGEAARARAQGGSYFTYETPLAYVGYDGNVYVGSLRSGQAAPLTDDSYREALRAAPFFRLPRNYGQIQWAPDYSKVLFIERGSGAVYMAEAGRRAVLMATTMGALAAWSPGSTEIAYVSAGQPTDTGTPMQIRTVAASGGSPRTAATFIEAKDCPPNATNPNPAEALYLNETGPRGATPLLAWMAQGFVRHSPCTNTLALVDGASAVRWQVENVARATIAPDRARAAAVQLSAQGRPAALAVIDLATGAATAVNIGPDFVQNGELDQVAWTADGQAIFFSTLTPLAVNISLDPKLLTPLFPGVTALSFKNHTARLWSVPAQGGAPTQLAELADKEGIGRIAPLPDGSGVLFSVIPSLVPLLKRVGSGGTAALAATPNVQLWYRSLGDTAAALPIFVTAGGQAVAGKGSFMVDAVFRANVFAQRSSELTLGKSALVVAYPPATVTLQQSPALAARVIRALRPAEVVNISGAPVTADGRRWWPVVTFEGETGWVIARDAAGPNTIFNLRPVSFAAQFVTFFADRTTLRPGQCAILTWDAPGATLTLLNGKPAPPGNSDSLCPTRSTSAVLVAFDDDGVWAAGLNITVSRN